MIKKELVKRLVQRGEELVDQPYQFIHFSGMPEADRLTNDLDHYPHAFVLACLMDRQMPAERCWQIPYYIKEKIGGFEFSRLSALSKEETVKLMRFPQPLHRFPELMGEIFFEAVQHIEQKYSGDASRIWAGKPSSATLVRRFLEFKGAGQKIATMAANLLVREFKIEVSDKYFIDVSLDVHVRRVLKRLTLVPVDATNEIFLYTAREMNPQYPGVIDLACWEIGHNWCRPRNPICESCYMNSVCPTK
jgi:endonuclease-3